MSRTELMAAVALAAGLALTIAEIATGDADGINMSAKPTDSSNGSFDLANRLGLGSRGRETLDPVQLAEGDLSQAYW